MLLREAWPLAAIVMMVIVPTLCVLWFMMKAVGNERFAIRQKLEKDYASRLQSAAHAAEEAWRKHLDAAPMGASGEGASELFERLVRQGLCDSTVILAGNGLPQYPSDVPMADLPGGPLWREAARAEFEQQDLQEAAARYAGIEEETKDPAEKARARIAQARCAEKKGNRDEALAVLRSLDRPDLRAACDPQGRIPALDAAIRALQLAPKDDWGRHELGPGGLIERLQSYAPPVIPAGQRRFLMHELISLMDQDDLFPSLEAEELAARYLRDNTREPVREALLPSSIDGLMHAVVDRPEGGSAVLLYRQEGLQKRMEPAWEPYFGQEARIALLSPGEPFEGEPFVKCALAEPLQGWRMAAYLVGPDPFEAAAASQIAAYLWTGLLVLAALIVTAVTMVHYAVRQLRLTRLKNELIATVSHELKTPLASMRVLGDTLREGRCSSPEQEREYLDLMAKENARLSHLIDNFLAFSRMERNKQAFEFAPVSLAEVIAEAAQAMGERLQEPGCTLTMEIPADMPTIQGDHNALVTVVLNLLDNAHKYTEKDKEIIVRAYQEGDQVLIQAEDNGIGMTRRASARVFERFYQADRSLARRAGGCGLGLSIVRFIVEAHDGTVHVTSTPGKGSTFTVHLPMERPEHHAFSSR